MALFIMILRKMAKNKWLVTSLFIGFVVSVGLVSSIPIYSEATLSKMLVKDLENLQSTRGIYPGNLYNKLVYTNQTPEEKNKIYNKMDRYMREQVQSNFKIPVQDFVADIQSVKLKIRENGNSTDQPMNMTLRSFSNLEEHITLLDGRMPAEQQPVNGVYEVLVTEDSFTHYNSVLDKEYVFTDKRKNLEVKFKLVGLMNKKSGDDPYFKDTDLSELKEAFVISDGIAKQLMLTENQIDPGSVGWFFALDYSKLELRFVEGLLKNYDNILKTMLESVSKSQVITDMPILPIIHDFTERAERLEKLMWSLNVPVLIMLSFYMFMVSNLIAERQKSEIAVLRSRGAARWQVIGSFAVEGIVLCGVAFATGPLLGLILTEMLGSSNGFLEFVQRSWLPTRLSEESYRYGAIAAGACFVIMIIPIIMATRVSIVGHKQQLARLMKSPLWHKMFLDIFVLALAIYGLFTFRKRLTDLQNLGLNANDLHIDTLQFLVPALFIMGAGLFLLRLYPWVLRLIYWIGKKWWPPSVYATLIHVGRSSSQYQFLMIFLIMTIATGVFSASAARTINNNTEDRIRYGNGADIVLTARWENDKPYVPGKGEYDTVEMQQKRAGHITKYEEPPFDPLKMMAGVESSAKVFEREVFFEVNDNGSKATLFGIDTDQFGETTWFRDVLLDYPLNSYLNLIAGDSQAVLISKSLADKYNVETGEIISVKWDYLDEKSFKVYGIIEYFPTFNPLLVQSDGIVSKIPMMIVGHLSRIQQVFAVEPYNVWLKLKPNVSTFDFYEGLKQSEYSFKRIKNTREDLVNAKNDPFLMALNGILTLGFVVSILVSFIGFLLYWILSLRGRTLQNGVLRALGLSLKQLIGMLGIEQLLTSGVAVLIGIIVGNTASRLYVPNFQISFNLSSLVPPFRVIIDGSDLIRIYVLVSFMLLCGLGILAYMMSRMRIHQALKLGED